MAGSDITELVTGIETAGCKVRAIKFQDDHGAFVVFDGKGRGQSSLVLSGPAGGPLACSGFVSQSGNVQDIVNSVKNKLRIN